MPALRPLICQDARGWLTYLLTSGSDEIHWSVRSIPERLHIWPVLQQYPVQILCIRFLHTFFRELLRYPECSLSFQSGNLTGQGKLRACQGHGLPLQMSSGFWYWSFQKSVQYFCQSGCHAEYPVSSLLSGLLPDLSYRGFLLVQNPSILRNYVLLNSLLFPLFFLLFDTKRAVLHRCGSPISF